MKCVKSKQNYILCVTKQPIPPGGGALECNLTGRCPFFKNFHNPFRKKNCISILCFEIFRLQNNRENNSILFLKTIAKTIAYCF